MPTAEAKRERVPMNGVNTPALGCSARTGSRAFELAYHIDGRMRAAA